MVHDDPIKAAARNRMVDDQIAARGITDRRVLAAMREVPRHAFVPATVQDDAYADRALPIEAGQTISQPYIVAVMAQAMTLAPDDRVLEIGSGSGYATAVLAHLAGEVFAIERHQTLVDLARQRLAELQITNVQIACADGTLGWPEQAPFDAITVAAGGPTIAEPLLAQLAIGGRLVMPVGPTPGDQALLRVHRTGEADYQRESLGKVHFVPLIGEEGWPPERG